MEHGSANQESYLLPGSFWRMTSGVVVEVARVYKHTVHYLGPLTHNRYIMDKASFLLGHCVTRADEPIDLRRHNMPEIEPINELTDALDTLLTAAVEIPEPKPKVTYIDIKPVIDMYLLSTDDRLEGVCKQIIDTRGTIYAEVPQELADQYERLSKKFKLERLVADLIAAIQPATPESEEQVTEVAEILGELRKLCHYDDVEVARVIVQNR